MQKYQVRFDYARRRMTLAKPGALTPEGAAIPFRVNEKTGLVSRGIRIGSAASERSAPATCVWRMTELRRPLAIGPDHDEHDFMDWYSNKNAVPVIGWPGGNVLRGYRRVLGVRVGDQLVRIGALRTRGASAAAIFAAMHGKRGQLKPLILERDGRRIRLEAHVTDF
jgi:hypothetical protein